jgi:hypothetical protein
MTKVFTGHTLSRNGGPSAQTTRPVSMPSSLDFVTPPGGVDFLLTLNGNNQTTTRDLPLDIANSASAGWNVSATSTTFSTGGGSPKRLSAAATTVQSSPTVVCDTSCILATNSIGYPWTLPAGTVAPTATKLFNASTSTGTGTQTVTPTFRLSVPANTYSGAYLSTWTFTLASGP